MLYIHNVVLRRVAALVVGFKDKLIATLLQSISMKEF